MEIPNLSQTPEIPQERPFSFLIMGIIAVVAISLGFGFSRLIPSSTSINKNNSNNPIAADTVKSPEDIKVGQIYGNTEKVFKDEATGSIEKGSINNEGTHILNRPGGLDQRASLTSSVIDLDLFVGRKVEVKGQTNASTKTGWLLDVGWLKVLE